MDVNFIDFGILYPNETKDTSFTIQNKGTLRTPGFLSNTNKFIIDSINGISHKIPELKILFAGRGILLESIKKYSQDNHVEKYVDVLGFRADIAELIATAKTAANKERDQTEN